MPLQYCPNVRHEFPCKYLHPKELQVKVVIIDLKFPIPYDHSAHAKGMVNERGSNRILPTHGFFAAAPISPMCGALRGQLQDPKLHLSGPVPLPGLCTVYLPGKSARHRSVSSCPASQTLSHGL